MFPYVSKAACVCRNGQRFMMLAPVWLPVCRTSHTPRSELRRSFLLAFLSSLSMSSFYFRTQTGSTSGAWVVLIEPFATNRKHLLGLGFCSLLFCHNIESGMFVYKNHAPIRVLSESLHVHAVGYSSQNRLRNH